MKRTLLFIFSLLLIACQSQGKYQYIETKGGNDLFLNTIEGKVVYVDKSNRIIDYVDLNLNLAEISKIKSEKASNDTAQKYRTFGEKSIAGTSYSASIRTRFYKDKLLYQLSFSPYGEDLYRNTNTISFAFTDTVGFTLEKVEPRGWTRIVEDNGTPIRLETNGQVPMTLENYFEIADWNLMWSEWRK
jgi:hypothetical protein